MQPQRPSVVRARFQSQTDFIHAWFPCQMLSDDPTWANHHVVSLKGSGFAVWANILLWCSEWHQIWWTHCFQTPCKPHDGGVAASLLSPINGRWRPKHQWNKVLEVVKSENLLAFMDIAYQGFGEDMDADVTAFAKQWTWACYSLFSNSFSKKSITVWWTRWQFIGGV